MWSNNNFIKKLRASENFKEWKFSMEAYLQLKDLLEAVKGHGIQREKQRKAVGTIETATDIGSEEKTVNCNDVLFVPKKSKKGQ